VDKLERLSPEDLRNAAATALAGTERDADVILAAVRDFVALDSLEKLETFFAAKTSDADDAAASDVAATIAARLADWRTLLAALDALGVGDFVAPDLTIVRGLAYYTGFVFEAFERTGDGRALAGGGRYDALVQKLGGPELPATGFGMGDVTLKNLLEAKGLLPSDVAGPDFYAIILAPECRAAALADIAALRRIGLGADYSFKEGKFGKLIQAAEQAGARKVLIYGPDEIAAGVVKVRDTQTRAEVVIAREPASGFVERLLTVTTSDRKNLI
jgi:histidyl-tRNA synthetase